MTGFNDLSMIIPLILTILAFMHTLNFMLSRVELEKSFITSGGRSDTNQASKFGCRGKVVDLGSKVVELSLRRKQRR